MIIGMILYVASYAIGIGNAAWVGVELFSDVNVRSIGAMYAACTNWAGSLVIASTFLTMLENITPTGTFSFFAGLCFIAFFFCLFLVTRYCWFGIGRNHRFLIQRVQCETSCTIVKGKKSIPSLLNRNQPYSSV